MTRGRHRQSSASPTTLPLAAVGALVVCGAALAMVGSDTRLLRLGVSCSLMATVCVAVLLRARERGHARELAAGASSRRRDEVALQEQQVQLESMSASVEKLNAEIASLREELAEVTAAHSAAVLVNTARWRPKALTRDGFLRAAAALNRPEQSPALAGPDELSLALRPIDLASTAALRKAARPEAGALPVAVETDETDEARDEPQVEQTGAEVIDLTVHDDTQPLRLTGVRKRA